MLASRLSGLLGAFDGGAVEQRLLGAQLGQILLCTSDSTSEGGEVGNGLVLDPCFVLLCHFTSPFRLVVELPACRHSPHEPLVRPDTVRRILLPASNLTA